MLSPEELAIIDVMMYNAALYYEPLNKIKIFLLCAMLFSFVLFCFFLSQHLK